MNRKMIVAAVAIFAVSLTIIIFSGLFTVHAPAQPTLKYHLRLNVDEYAISAVFDEWEGLNISRSVVEIHTMNDKGEEIIIHQPGGPVHYGALVLRHGMSSDYDLYEWMVSSHVQGPFEKLTIDVTVFDDTLEELVRFDLIQAWPSAWSFSSGPKGITIEELVIQYDSLELTS